MKSVSATIQTKPNSSISLWFHSYNTRSILNVFSLTPTHKIVERHFSSVDISLFLEPAIQVQAFHKHPWKWSAEEVMKANRYQSANSLQWKIEKTSRENEICVIYTLGDNEERDQRVRTKSAAREVPKLRPLVRGIFPRASGTCILTLGLLSK